MGRGIAAAMFFAVILAIAGIANGGQAAASVASRATAQHTRATAQRTGTAAQHQAAGRHTQTGAPVTKTVRYDGYTFKVPAKWPVYRLGQDSTRCVRYDTNAVYLGTPGDNQRCPAHLIGQADTVSVVPSGTAPASGVPGMRMQSAPAGGQQAASGSAAGARVTVTATYGVHPAAVRQVLRSVHNASTGRPVPLRQSAQEQSAPHQSAPHQSAPHQSAPHQSAPHQSAPHQQALHHSAPRKSAPRKSALHQSALRKSALHRSAAVPASAQTPAADEPAATTTPTTPVPATATPATGSPASSGDQDTGLPGGVDTEGDGLSAAYDALNGSVPPADAVMNGTGGASATPVTPVDPVTPTPIAPSPVLTVPATPPATTPASTPAPVSTPTQSPTPTPSLTPTQTPAPTQSPTPTASPSPTAPVTSTPATPKPAPPKPTPSKSTPPKSTAPLPGFDTCTAPSLSVMRAWRRSYSAAAIYIGGAEMACDYGNLSASWVRAVHAMGWSLIPLYVGRQAPCNGYSEEIKPGQAAAEGSWAAGDAVADAKALGLPTGSPIYFDMEGYNDTKASCRNSVLSFLGSWSQEIGKLRYSSGMYSSASSGAANLVSAKSVYGRKLVKPASIWFALWDGRADLNGSPYLNGSWWPESRRIKQYRGSHEATVGKAKLDIDSDWVAGVVYRG